METKPSLTPLQRAFLALEAAETRLAQSEGALREPIAIIGLGCRVPGADDAQAFWTLMRDGVDATTPPPPHRFPADAAKGTVRNAGYLREVDGFEPEFFKISKREADGMDPQQRLLLEVAWEALESAGQAPDRLERSATGVYVGICAHDYNSLQLASGDSNLVNPHYASGVAHSVASGRISYVLGLQGPSLSIDTACSSSLVAIHLACQALRVGDCRMALAGGVNLMLSTEPFAAFAESRMLAGDGRCKTFDAAADGFARGEGCGIVVLKRLADAQADGDDVLAVIRGSAVNQDGPSSGLTAPNGPAQEAVIRTALQRAGVEPREVGYIEAHGTGTQLGDPLEVQALGEVFARGRAATEPLLLGAVKTNIGHLEAAAGVAGLIKVVLALQHGAIPAHLHFRSPSPHIDWEQLPFRVPTALTAWPSIMGRRIAGLSSFGFSGTNAHVVVEQAPTPPARPAVASRPAELYTISARTETALRELARRTSRSLDGRDDVDLADLCRTASVGRAHLAERATVIARDVPALRRALDAIAGGDEAPGLQRGRIDRRDPPRIALLFTGQGVQYAGMACALYEQAPVFRQVLDRCAAVLDRQLPRPLLEVLRDRDAAAAEIDQTLYTQPALFAVEYSLAELLKSWGIEPSIVMGHSVGEYVAACVAGVMPLEPALELIAARARLMQSLSPGGAMAAIYADAEQVEAAVHAFGGRLAIAAVNAPGQSVVSGALEPVDLIVQRFSARGVRAQRLSVSHAFHSPLVEPVLDEFEHFAAKMQYAAPAIRVISNRTGLVATRRELQSAAYWRDHLRETVRFADGLRTLEALKPDLCIEVGPHPALTGFAAMSFGAGGPLVLPTLRRERDDWMQMLDMLQAAHLSGVEINWRSVFHDRTMRSALLPTYPFERERCWFASRRRRVASPAGNPSAPLLGVRLRSAGIERIHEYEVDAESPAFVAQHRVQGRILMPATGLLASLVHAASDSFGRRAILEQVTLQEALVVDDDPSAARTVQVIGTPQPDGALSLTISSAASDGNTSAGWTHHVTATARLADAQAPAAIGLAEARSVCADEVDRTAFYQRLATHGLDFGPAFRSVARLWRGRGAALGEISLAESLVEEASRYPFHPVLLDGCIQVIAAAVDDPGGLYLPFSIGHCAIHGNPGRECVSHVRSIESGSDATRRADLAIFDAAGVLVAEIADVRLKRVTADALAKLGRRWLDEALYDVEWIECAATASGGVAVVSIEELQNAAMADLDGLRVAAGLDQYDAFLPRLDGLCLELTARALLTLGWNPAVDECVSTRALAGRLGIAAQHRLLFGRLLEILAEDRLLTKDGDQWRVARALTSVQPGPDAAALAAAYPPAAAEVEITGRAGAEFAAALRGEIDPLQLLFPAGSTDTAEKLYRDTPPARVFNGLMATIAAELASRRAASRPLRILEIGAGTGGTTAHVLPRLPTSGVEYTFTDIGALFVARARERFGELPFMKFATLDLETEPEMQGFAPGSYDLVLASNVIHATRNLRRTLVSVGRLLAPGGVLAMLEVTAPQRWFDLTVGLTPGWWCFEDTDLRPNYATLTAERWIQLLTDTGFERAVALPGTADHSRTLALNTLLLARLPAAAASQRARQWVVFADEAPFGATLVDGLRATGEQRLAVRTAAVYRREAHHVELDPTQPDHLRQLVELAAANPVLETCFVFACGTEHRHTSDESAADLAAAATSRSVAIMQLARAIAARGLPARIWVLSRGAQQVTAADATVDPAQAATHGLVRALGLEHPELHATCLDLDSGAGAEELPVLLAELQRADAESHLAIRAGKRYVARLVHARPIAAVDAATSVSGWRLAHTRRGSLDRFERVPMQRRAPGSGEVEIDVHAVGLNFKDVLNVLGMYPGDPGPLGGECAGVVVAAGAGVDRLRPGDAVMALGGGSFASHVTTRAEFVQKRAPGQSAVEGASIPIPFLTAHFCLEHLAKLRRGERVLIHAAAGGVGLAAVRLAQQAGAQVFATAGAPWKRALLRSIGVEQVFDSRRTEFADQILAATGGAGVDVVLNSLSGPQIEASFRAIARGGRFVEIGKRDIKSQEWVSALEWRLQYHIVDWGQTAAQDPDLIGRMFAEVAAHLGSGALVPLPRHVFGLKDVGRAFRFMAAARHAGKIVVELRPPGEVPVQPNGTYIVTGGLSGLGPVVARWLAQRGAGRLVLVSRRGVTAEVEPLLRELRAGGTQVVAEALDISDADAVVQLMRRLHAEGPPLRGIVHSAGTLDDAALVQQDAARYASVFAPKVLGTALLDAHTRADPLDWVVYFSSIAAILGSAGQSNHSAANAFLDAMARDAQLRGLPVTSINWGPWAEAGAAVDRGVAARIGALGVEALTLQQGLMAMEQVMLERRAQAIVLPVDWARFRAQFGVGSPPQLLSRVLEGRPPAVAAPRSKEPRQADVATQLANAPVARRRPLLVNFLRERILKVLGLDPARSIDPRKPLGEMGLDSLLAVELRNAIGDVTGRQLPATLLFDYPTLEALSDFLLAELGVAPADTDAPRPVEASPAPNLVESIADLSDEEVERQLAARAKRKQ